MVVQLKTQSENVFDLCVNFFLTSSLCSMAIAQGEWAIIVIALVFFFAVPGFVLWSKKLQEGSNRFYLLFFVGRWSCEGELFPSLGILKAKTAN